jgi:hypothetical protein
MALPLLGADPTGMGYHDKSELSRSRRTTSQNERFAMKHPLLFLLFIVALAGTLLAEVTVDFDTDTDFLSYRTYAWREGTPAHRDSAQKRIIDAVNHEMQAKGLRRVDATPDIVISTHVLVDKHGVDELSNPDLWNFLTGVTSVDPVKLRAGTLVIDVVDARTEEHIWRGVTSESLDEVPEKNLKKIDKIVAKLLKQLPR